MKKFVSPLPSGGFPLTNDAILNLQDQTYTTIQKLYGSVAGAWIVDGVNPTSINATAKTVVVSSGYVFLNGEVRAFSGYSGSYPFYIISATDVIEQATYANGAVQNAYVTKNAATTTSIPGSGTPYITMNPGNDSLRLAQIITGPVSSALGASIGFVDDKVSVLRTDLTALTTRVTNVQTALDTKATKRVVATPWTDITISGNWQPRAGAVPQYMVDEFGWVHCRGNVYTVNGNYMPGNAIFAILPTAIRPTRDVVMGNSASTARVSAATITGGSNNSARAINGFIVVDANQGYLGWIWDTFANSSTATGVNVYLDGLTWPLL